MKKKLLYIVCALVIFIPTIIAISFYSYAQSNPVTKGAVYKMTLTDIDGNVFEFNSDDPDDKKAEAKALFGDDAISFFIDMSANSEKVGELPAAVAAGSTYTAVYSSYNLQTVYKYYFTTDSNYAYYTDHNGNVYHIDPEDAQKFVLSSYAVCLYKDAAAPEMKVGETTVNPESMDWYYKLSTGQFSNAVVNLAKTTPNASVRGTLNLSFTTQPDYVFVTIMDGETRIYNDVYANLSSMKFTESKTLSVGVSAQWYQSDDRDSYGEAYYRFTIDVKAPAEFYLGTTEINPGDFVVITGKNVTDVDKITFTSTPDINFTPTFFTEGESVIALVPISYELTYNSAYTFTLDYEGSSTTLTLNVADKTFAWRDYDISSEIIASTRTQASIAAFNEALADAWANKLDTRYWKTGSDNLFSYPCPTSRQVKIGIGVHRTLTATGTEYRHQGVDFMVSDGDQVYAACEGEVVYVGTLTLSGRTIVIDHGFGLKTLYAHLNSTTVSVGDHVSAGAVIGVVGNGGFTASTNLHFGMYVFDVPVSPYDAWGWDKDGIQIYQP